MAKNKVVVLGGRMKGDKRKPCVSSWDCGSNEQCRRGYCEIDPECKEDEQNCGECLGPPRPSEPNPNAPNCGKGDISDDTKIEYEQCVFTCTAFCDEWYKIVGNLTPDTDIKDCTPDDACSNCRICDSGGNCEDLEGSARPCYCPPYVNKSGNTVDDSQGKDCYICDTDNGDWELQEDLCQDSCSQTVVCDDGRQRTATVSALRGTVNDVCHKAFQKALDYCNSDEDETRRCPYKQAECEVVGPLSGVDVTYTVENALQTYLETLQSGQQPMPEGGGDYLKLNMVTASSAAPGNQPVRIDPARTQINGGEVKFNVVDGYVTLGGGLPPRTIKGKVKLEGKNFVGETITVEPDVETSPEGEQLTYLWFLDNEPVQENDDSNPAQGVLADDRLSYIIGEEDVEKILTCEVTIEDETTDAQGRPTLVTPTIKSNLIGPILPEAVDVDAEIEINGNFVCGNTLTVDLSELQQYRPIIDPISLQWIEDGTGLTFGAQNFLFLEESFAGKEFFCRATFINYYGETQFIDSPLTAPIINADVTIGPCDGPDGSVSISGTPRENEVLTANATTPSTSAGPFYQWYDAQDLLLGEIYETLELRSIHVGKKIRVEIMYRDVNNCYKNYTSVLTSEIQNDPSEATGAIYIIGEARVAKTLTTVNNIRDEDGLQKIQYQWFVDDEPVEGEQGTKSTLRVTELMEGKHIKVVAWWVDDYEQDKQVESRETAKVLPSKEQVVLTVRPVTGLAAGTSFPLYIDITKPDDVLINSIQTYTDWTPKAPVDQQGQELPAPGSKIALDPNEAEQAENGSLAIEWVGEDTPECPEGWACFYSLEDGRGNKFPGGNFFHKCPFPGYPDITYEEYQDNLQCKRTCEDVCYQFTITAEKGEEPELGPGEDIKEIINNGTDTVTYLIEYCVEGLPETEDECRGDKQRYVGVFYQFFEPFQYFRCSCDGVGEALMNPGGHDFTYTTPGVGPWQLLEWGEGPEPEGYNCPWQQDFSSLLKCPKLLGNPAMISVCGGNGKYAPLRSWWIEDGLGTYTEIISGSPWWSDITYVNADILQWGAFVGFAQATAQETKYFRGKPGEKGVVVPMLPPESVAKRCPPSAPEQVAYVNRATRIWYGYDEELFTAAKEDRYSPQWMDDVTFSQLEAGEPLYSTKAYEFPYRDKEPRPTVKAKIPEILGPERVSYDNTGSLNLGRYLLSVSGFEAESDTWRFVNNFSSIYGSFEITSSGQLRARSRFISDGVYNVELQVYLEPLWSRAYPVQITVS